MQNKLTRQQRIWRSRLRVVVIVAIVVCGVGGLVVLDRLGLFGSVSGKYSEDISRYDGGEFRVERVIDGDTLIISALDDNGKPTRIRLWGVDTPETVKPNHKVDHFGPEASQFARIMCEGKVVRIGLDPDRSSRDRYGRLLAYIILPDGRMLNRLLIERGFGYFDPRYKHRYYSEFATTQSDAQAGRRGLWKDVRDKDLPFYLRGKIKLPGR